jgi:hypothetical protein
VRAVYEEQFIQAQSMIPMINHLSDSTFTVPLNLSAHRLAERFRQQHTQPDKAKQVYLNTLAVSAVNFYLRCMGIETNWETSQSYDPVMQAVMDVADLEIRYQGEYQGRLECRPVLPQVQVVQIPAEVWAERIGCVAVRLDSSLREATLLGFTEMPEVEELPVSQLRSLDDLLDRLRQLRTPQPVTSPIANKVNLSQWLQGRFEAGWRSLEDLIGSDQQLLFSLRTDPLANSLANSLANEATVKRAKLLDLELQLGSQPAVLLVAITPENEQKVGILVQLHPSGSETYLPPNFQLALLSETGDVLQQVRSRSQDNYIQLKRFRGLFGERFDLQLTLGEVRITESFTI